MNSNDSRKRQAELQASVRCAVPLVVLVGLLAVVLVGLLLVADTAQAEMKPTNVVDAWDFIDLQYKHSKVNIPFNGGWTSFWHQLDFDAFPSTSGSTCPAPGTTWSGQMLYALYSVDNAPAGARGFVGTRNWELVDCDRNADGKFNNADLSVQPPTYRLPPVLPTVGDYACSFPPTGTHCVLVGKDEFQTCTTGNCAQEIVTTFNINLDLDCDGAVDHPLPPAGLCFYAEAQTAYPAPGDPLWSGPLQARISIRGLAGDKTVSFTPVFRPTSVDLASFGATLKGDDVLLAWETANELDNLGFHLYRATSPTGQKTRLNKRLIPSQMPGSVIGATYTFLDTAAEPGRIYYYWLEDVDVEGVATLNGPVPAGTPPVKALPGRPRPAPAPGLAR